MKISPRYATDVVALDKNRFRASCLWLARRGALSPEDVEVAWAIREQRHAVAHELSRYVVDPDASIDLTLFSHANRLMTALGRFWGRMVVEADERFDDQTVQDEEIESGPMILMNHILSVVRRHDT